MHTFYSIPVALIPKFVSLHYSYMCVPKHFEIV